MNLLIVIVLASLLSGTHAAGAHGSYYRVGPLGERANISRSTSAPQEKGRTDQQAHGAGLTTTRSPRNDARRPSRSSRRFPTMRARSVTGFYALAHRRARLTLARPQ